MYFKQKYSGSGGGAHFNPSSGEADAGGSLEFKAGLVCIEFQASQGYTVRPCLKKDSIITFLQTHSYPMGNIWDKKVQGY